MKLNDIAKKAKHVGVAGMVAVAAAGLPIAAMDDVMVEPPKKQLDINRGAYYGGTSAYEIMLEVPEHTPGTASAVTISKIYGKAAEKLARAMDY